MSIIEKAIDFFKNTLIINITPGRKNGKHVFVKTANQSFNIAIQCMKKQVPTKPIEQATRKDGTKIGICSQCRKWWVNEYFHFCPYCGQAIDWKE